MALSDLALYDDQRLLAHFTTRQRQILAAAIDVFADVGYANASTKQIAAAAGVAEGNIFAKFKNKQGLLDALLQPVMTAIAPATFQSFVAANFTQEYPTLAAFINPMVHERLAFLQTHPKLLKILFSELAYSQLRREQLARALPETQRAVIHEEFANLQARHLLVGWPDTDILRVLWSLLGGTATMFLFYGTPPNADQLSQTMCKALQPDALSR